MSDRKSPDTEITCMVMVENKETGEVLVQERCLSWKGIAFPGGHVEKGESFYMSAVREIKEETGLEIKNLIPCGVIHWSERNTGERYLVFAYKTSDYSGELVSDTEEGRVFWVKPESLREMNLCENFETYLSLFFDEEKHEMFGLHDKNDETVKQKTWY
jgi:8-oxo-dGTP diphosphatase